MPRRLAALLVAAIAVGLLTAAPALAALSDEGSAGQSVAVRLQSGQASCQDLSNSGFEHLGEYVMDRMVGSRATHEAETSPAAPLVFGHPVDEVKSLTLNARSARRRPGNECVVLVRAAGISLD